MPILVALLLAIVKTLVRPILVFFPLPITLLTLGLFLLVVNGAMVLLVDWRLEGFRVDGWLWAILFVVLMAVLNFFVGGLGLGGEGKKTA